MTQPEQIREQRDQARNIAAHLEAENARLTQTLQDVKIYANELVSAWGAQNYGLDILAILNGERES